MARLSTLILVVSKRSTRGSPQPHWPPAPSAWPLRTVESPTRKSVGSLGFVGGLSPIFACAAGSVVEPSMGTALAGSCACSPMSARPMIARVSNNRNALNETDRDNTGSFDIETVYPREGQRVKLSSTAYSQRHDMGILGAVIRIIRRCDCVHGQGRRGG